MFFNLIDLLILATLSLLTGPKIYSMHRTQVDDFAVKVRNQTLRAVNLIKEKIPFPIMIGGKVKQT